MRDLKIEITDNGSAVYIGIEPPGHCICTTQPSELILAVGLHDLDREILEARAL